MAYQTNCGMGDDTPEGFTFVPTSFAGECQCGQGGCFGEFGEFVPNDHQNRDDRFALKKAEEESRQTHYCDHCGEEGHLKEDCFNS